MCCAGPPNQIPPAVTVWDGIHTADPNAVYASSQASAVADASGASAIVAVVGEKPYAEGLGDNPAPQLSSDQQALISALGATGKPVIVVVVAGRPVALGPAETAAGLIMAYLPGKEGGNGGADVLFGKYDPSGRLPVTWPTDAPTQASGFNPGGPSTLGDEPKIFDQFPGHELRLGLRLQPDVVPVYVSRPLNSDGILRPPLQLVGFARVELAAGTSKTASVSFPVSELAVTTGDINGDGPRRVQPGGYQVQVGSQAADFTVS